MTAREYHRKHGIWHGKTLVIKPLPVSADTTRTVSLRFWTADEYHRGRDKQWPDPGAG
jgi:hypothetical protein